MSLLNAPKSCERSSFSIYLLDTNVISEAWKDVPDEGVAGFLKQTPATNTFLSLFTLTELRYGIHLLAPGKRKQDLEHAYEATLNAYRPRIIPPDLRVAETYARRAAEQRQEGTPRPIFDLWLASTAEAYELTLVTRNVRDFGGLSVKLLNPFRQ